MQNDTAEWSIYKVGSDSDIESDQLALVEDQIVLPYTILDDGQTYVYTTAFVAAGLTRIVFKGLVGSTRVLINKNEVLHARSMFVAYEHVFHANGIVQLDLVVQSAFNAHYPIPKRPRWKQRLTDKDELRFIRSTFLGHMPGWCPSINVLGPYRDVLIQDLNTKIFKVLEHRVSILHLESPGRFLVSIDVDLVDHSDNNDCKVVLAGVSATLVKIHTNNKFFSSYYAELEILETEVELWYPHTHGSQPQYNLEIQTKNTSVIIGKVSFRSLRVDRGSDGTDFDIIINSKRIFCRGACWTSTSLSNLQGSSSEYKKWLTKAKDAGMNMVRISGNMLYESKEFYNLCDELGIMVWQDFMFSNFDYPQNQEFLDQVVEEAKYFIARTSDNCCITVLCGGSEVFQQAAMYGLQEHRYQNVIFDTILKDIVAEDRKDACFVCNSPSGGVLPFQTDVGISHYYGVGAYLRDFSDLRRSNVKFASECLALSNIPCDDAIAELNVPYVHHPEWKKGVPRDNMVSWDVEDVRDHYLQEIYDVDPNFLRRQDPERYLMLSRAVSYDLIVEAFSEWRSSRSHCGGALIWQFQDVQAGAGWGILDHKARPKAAYYAAKQVFKPLQVLITDEGLNGLDVHVINEQDNAVNCKVVLRVWRDSKLIMQGNMDLHDFCGIKTFNSNLLLAGFFDITYAFRFGPVPHDVTTVDLVVDDVVVSRATHLPKGRNLVSQDQGFEAIVSKQDDSWILTVSTKKFLRLVHCSIPGFRGDNEWVDLVPNETWSTKLLSDSGCNSIPKGFVAALNVTKQVEVTVAV